ISYLLTSAPELTLIEPRIQLPLASLLDSSYRSAIDNDSRSITSVEEKRSEASANARHAPRASVHTPLSLPFAHIHTDTRKHLQELIRTICNCPPKIAYRWIRVVDID